MRALLAALTLALAMAIAGSSSAQVDDDRARALELGREGVALYGQNRWLEAYARLEQADALVHSPVFVLYMARSKRQLGQLLAARALYERVVGEPAAADEIEPWRVARAEAKAELTALRIPKISIVVPRRAPGEIWIDGARLTAQLGEMIEIDPGDHEIVVRMLSGEVIRGRARVQEGDPPHAVDIGWPIARPAPVAPSPIPQPVVVEPSPTQRRAAIGLMAVGGVLGAVSIGTGIAAAVAEADLEGACPDGVCGAENAEDVDRYYALAHTTTAMLVGGGAILGLGIVLFLTAPSAHEASALIVEPGRLRFRVAF